MAASITWSL